MVNTIVDSGVDGSEGRGLGTGLHLLMESQQALALIQTTEEDGEGERAYG